MIILVECRDRNVSRFCMENEGDSAELIESIRPSELFRQPHLRVQAGKSGSIFIMNEVESIRFVTSIRVKHQGLPPVRDFQSLTERDYAVALRGLRDRYEPMNDLFLPGTEVETLFAVNCVSGRVHFLKADVVLGHRLEQTLDMRTGLERLTAMIPCPDGYLAINPVNITKIEMYPSPPVPDHGGWLVD